LIEITLGAILAEPARVADAPIEALAALLVQLAAVQAAIAARLAAGLHRDDGPDRLLTVKQAAPALGMSEDWLYRNADRLPFTRRTGPRTVRFSEKALKRYLADHRA
jgi:excisionase family DNA binding protein